MTSPRRPARAVLPGLAVCLAAFGCAPGPPAYKVTGKILKGGQPLAVTENVGRVEVEFVPVLDDSGEAADPQDVEYDQKSGQFTAVGADRRGLPPGKYRLAVHQYDPYPDNDLLGNRFGADNSPLVYEIKGNQDIPPIELTAYK
jgi:hypothetical protein